MVWAQVEREEFFPGLAKSPGAQGLREDSQVWSSLPSRTSVAEHRGKYVSKLMDLCASWLRDLREFGRTGKW